MRIAHLSAVVQLADLKEGLPGLFALGQKPAPEQLVEWLPDRWLHRIRDSPGGAEPGH